MTQFTDEGGISDEEGPQFNSLVVDKNTGRVYIGAVNKLYQLSPNLEQMVSVCYQILENLCFYFCLPLSKLYLSINCVSAHHQSHFFSRLGQ